MGIAPCLHGPPYYPPPFLLGGGYKGVRGGWYGVPTGTTPLYPPPNKKGANALYIPPLTPNKKGGGSMGIGPFLIRGGWYGGP
jgi:hypothetical protein